LGELELQCFFILILFFVVVVVIMCTIATAKWRWKGGFAER